MGREEVLHVGAREVWVFAVGYRKHHQQRRGRVEGNLYWADPVCEEPDERCYHRFQKLRQKLSQASQRRDFRVAHRLARRTDVAANVGSQRHHRHSVTDDWYHLRKSSPSHGVGNDRACCRRAGKNPRHRENADDRRPHGRVGTVETDRRRYA